VARWPGRPRSSSLSRIDHNEGLASNESITTGSLNHFLVRWLDGKEVDFLSVMSCDPPQPTDPLLFSFHFASLLLSPAIYRMLKFGLLSVVGVLGSMPVLSFEVLSVRGRLFGTGLMSSGILFPTTPPIVWKEKNKSRGYSKTRKVIGSSRRRLADNTPSIARRVSIGRQWMVLGPSPMGVEY